MASYQHDLPRAHRQRRGLSTVRYTVQLLALDYLLGWASAAVGLLLLSGFSRNSANDISLFGYNLEHAFWFPIGIWCGVGLTGRYRRSQRSPTESLFAQFPDYAGASALAGVIAMGFSYFLHHFGSVEVLVSTQVLMASLVATFAISIGHGMLRHATLRAHPVRIAVVDNGSSFARIQTHLHLQHGVVSVGRIEPVSTNDAQSLGALAQIDQIISQHRIDRVIFGAIGDITDDVAFWYRRTTELVDTGLVPRMFDVVSWRSHLTDLSGLPVLELAPRHVGMLDRALKRVLDLSVASALLLVLSPVFVAIAIAIKLTSRGPIFFRQERLGRDRQPFTILKFRTMVASTAPESPADVAAESAAVPLYVQRGKLSETNRVTAVGRVLRRCGLDEIPQFFNVITGSMSVVGPRPFIPNESEINDPVYARRYDVRPGITGLWQVSGRNNLTDEELRQLDFLYVTSWSLWWDIKICADTPRAMIRGLGAY
jgi:exopolysaccharide biosynthesis polyprenyl glycosylphosphotransferase